MKRFCAPRTLVSTLLLALAAALTWVQSARAAVDEPARLVPDTAIVYAEITDTASILDKLLDPTLTGLLLQSDQSQKYLNSNQFNQVKAVVGLLEQRLNVKWADALRDLYGSIHVAFNPGTNSALFIVRARKPDLLANLHREILALVEADAVSRGQPSPAKTVDYQGVKTWNFGDKQFQALVDDAILISNNADGLHAALDRHSNKGLKSLVDVAEYQQARGLVESGQAGWAMLRLAPLRLLPNVTQALSGKSNNPLIELLLGGLVDTVREAPVAALSLHTGSDRWRLKAYLPRDPAKLSASRAWYFSPQAEHSAPSPLRPAGAIGVITTYRDLSSLWLSRDDLFDEATVAGLAQADTNLGLFFSGRDFGSEVLGQLTPRVQIVVARQEFAADQPVPAIKFPSVALVLEMKEPQRFAQKMLVAYQKFLGLINIQAAQTGSGELLLSTEEYRGVSISKATYLVEPDAEKKAAPNYFNASPSCARVGDRFIIASTTDIVRRLVDALQDPAAAAPTRDNLLLEISVPQLAEILADNREVLVSQNMLSAGRTREQAEQQIGLLFSALRLLGKAQVRLAGDQRSLELEASVSGP